MKEAEQLRCLTIHQPWATLIINGDKTVENRMWSTNYRGLLAIHAGISRASLSSDLPDGFSIPDDLAFGVILGVVTLVDCVLWGDPRVSDNPFTTGPECWILANPRPLPKPIPFKGLQKLYRLSQELTYQITTSLVDA